MLFEIVKETGWTLHYILWKINRANLYLMLADRSRFEKTEKQEKDNVVQESGHDFAARHKR